MISEEVRQNFAVAAAMEDHDGSWIAGGAVQMGQLALTVEPAHIVAICRFLKESHRFRLSGITGVDWFPLEPRFEVIYFLHCIERNERLRLRVRLPGDNPVVDSVTGVWSGANWYERETFDLFGVEFRNHPNLTRIMMPEGWEGHPLRKDFPVHGHRYSYAEDEGNVL